MTDPAQVPKPPVPTPDAPLAKTEAPEKERAKSPADPAKSRKPPIPSGPGLKVAAFVDLMKRLEAAITTLSDEQARFIRLSIQRFEHEQQGTVRTKLTLPKPKQPKSERSLRPTLTHTASHSDAQSDALLDRLTHAATEDEVITAIEQLSDERAERLAAAQGLRSTSPAQARQNLLDTVITLRQMSRIQNAGKPSKT